MVTGAILRFEFTITRKEQCLPFWVHIVQAELGAVPPMHFRFAARH